MEAVKEEKVVDWRQELVEAVREVAEQVKGIKKEISGIREEMIVARRMAEKREDRSREMSGSWEESGSTEESTESEREGDTGDDEEGEEKDTERKEGRKQEGKEEENKTEEPGEVAERTAGRIADEIKKQGGKEGWSEMIKEEEEQKEKAEDEEKKRRVAEEKKAQERSEEERSRKMRWRIAARKTEERKEERRRRAEQRDRDERWREEQEERRKRRKNMILRGEVDVKEIGIQEMKELIQEGLGKEMEIEKIVKKKQIGGEGMVIVEMKDEKDKKELWERRREMEAAGAEVCEDLTWWERKTRYKLREKAAEERRKGKRVWIENRKLIVDGREIEFDERTERWMEEEGEKEDDNRGSPRDETSDN